jgi:hypothetical protein
MNGRGASQSRSPRDGQRGQALLFVGFLLTAILGAAALVIDIGNLYYSYMQLLYNAQAAALAGGEAVPNGNAQSIAYKYSGDSASPYNAVYNVRPNLDITGVTATPTCLAPVTGVGLPPCAVYGMQASANAVVVTETASVNTYFAGIFGIKKLNISATATASAKGGSGTPYDIMMVLDTTNSMSTSYDTGCTVPGLNGTPTAEQCAQYGIQQLMGSLDPCSLSLSSCGSETNGNYTNPVDRVGIMVFPGLCSSTNSGMTTNNCPAASSLTSAPNSTYASNDYSCPASNPPITSYNNNPAYLVLPFQSDYRTSDTIASLNSNANIVKAVGAGVGNCSGIQAPGGEGTFYAGAIDAAQSYLTANARANVQEVIILLSDGDATASSGQMGGSVTTYSSTAECTQAGSSAATAKGTSNPYTSSMKTIIYSVSYGSETSGCTGGESANYTTPCLTMQNIASTPSATYFFSVPQTVNGVQSTVCSGARPDTSLNEVFTDIAGDLTTSRLIPNNTP